MNPYFCDGPTILNISGGRTSGLMLRRILDAHDGMLPPETFAVFANTGRERPETLTFLATMAERWGVTIHWIERDHTKPSGKRFRVVTAETASRKGEPFEQLITERKFLPNGIARFCTQETKIIPARDFMRSHGFDHWTSVMGLRFDEPARVSRVRDREPGEWDVACPLYDARVTGADVLAFWRAQPFDLALRPHESNCDGCLAAETEVVTRDGIRRIGDIAGETHELLIPKMANGTKSEVGHFVAAPVRSFGVQRLWRIELTRQGRGRKTVFATAEHRWFPAKAKISDAMPDETTTEHLKPGTMLRSLFRCPIGEDRGGSSRIAALRGFVFGDGATPSGERPGTIDVFDGPKFEAFGEAFSLMLGEPAKIERRDGERTAFHYYGVPRYWKLDLPSLRESRHYLMGWLAGWFAADGHVSDSGVCSLHAANPMHLEFARSVCAVLGVQCSSLRSQTRRVTPPHGHEREHTMYAINLNRSHLTADFFWLRHHRERAEAARSNQERTYRWTVESVAPTDRIEEVFCATVDGVGAFALADGLMTGNCYLKSAAILERIERDHPGTLDWWDAQEKRIGATFKPNLPRAKIIARARLPMLPLALDTDEDPSLPCNCTD